MFAAIEDRKKVIRTSLLVALAGSVFLEFMVGSGALLKIFNNIYINAVVMLIGAVVAFVSFVALQFLMDD